MTDCTERSEGQKGMPGQHSMTVTDVAAPDRSGTRGVARGGLANMVGSALAGGTGVVVTWIVARSLGAEQAGAFFAATAAFVLAGGLAKLGTQTGLVYWPARLRATGRDHLLGACLRIALTPVVVLALVLAVAMWFGAPAIAHLTAEDSPHVTAGHTTALRVLAVFLPLQALTDALLTATRGYKAMRPTVTLDRVLRSTLQLLCVGAVGVATLWGTATLPAFAFAWAVPYVPVVFLAAVALRRTYLAARPAGPRTRRRDRRQLRRDFWRFTGPRALASVAQLALQRIDVLLVAALGGLAPAAIYAVAGRFVVLIQFANQGISQSVQPRLAEALAVGDRDTANHLYQAATGWLVLVTWPITFLVILFAPVYLGLFGGGYRSGADVVVVLGCAMLVATGCGMVDMVLAMAGRTSWNLINVLVALGVTVGLDVLLIPRYGALGAAIGLACAMVANNVLPLIQVGRAARLHPFGPGTLAAAGLSVACFGVLPRLVTVVAGAGPAGMSLAVALAVPAFAAGAWLLRGRLGLNAFKPRKLTQRRTG
jgi:O-antigen/teichoic acid export membrane protein